MNNTIKHLLLLLLAFMPCLILASSLHQHHGKQSTKDWTDQDLAVLKDLWIGSLAANSFNQQNNRYANNEAAMKLGHQLFFDARFSANGKISCAHCHQPQRYFSDGLPKAQGLGQAKRNTPSIVGSTYSHWLFHDGRADSLWSQALGPLEHPLEHGGNRNQFAKILYNDKTLRQQYESLFGPMPNLHDEKRFPINEGKITEAAISKAWNNMDKEAKQQITTIFVNIAKAIAAYESLLIPGPARFDQYVAGLLRKDKTKQNMLNRKEIKGLKLFIGKAMCTMCHNGPLFSNFEMHNIGTLLHNDTQFDWGRYDGAQSVLDSPFNCRSRYNDNPNKSCKELEFIVLGKKHTVGSFKTPSLRNVSKTAPYMHDGRYSSLKRVIKHYAHPPKQRIGKIDLMEIQLDEKEQDYLEAFLHSLDSEIDAHVKWLNKP